MSFSEQMEFARSRGVTGRDIAKELGVHPNLADLWLAGAKKPPEVTRKEIGQEITKLAGERSAPSLAK